MRSAADLLEEASSRYEAEQPPDESLDGPAAYRRRARSAMIVQMLRSGGVRTYELPQPQPATTDELTPRE
jgi:hypothetical protein